MSIDSALKGRFIIAESVSVGEYSEIHDFSVIKRTIIGSRTKIWNHVNIYDSEIGDDNSIASFVEIGGAKIGSHNKIEAGAYIPKGVIIKDRCFIGPKVSFANDKYPKTVGDNWEWTVGEVKIGNNVSIGIGSIILPNVTIGDHTFIAAGSLVASDVPPHSFAMGRPAHVVSMQTMKELGIL